MLNIKKHKYISLNGVYEKTYKQGFYYYNQTNVDSICPQMDPKVLLYGERFKLIFLEMVSTVKLMIIME